MLPQIASALANGFTYKQILDFIVRKFPQHGEKIKTALIAGYSADQILKYISGGREELNSTEGKTDYEQTRNTDLQRESTINRGTIAAGGLALAPLAIPMAAKAMQHAFPSTLVPSAANAPSLAQPQAPLPSLETMPKNTGSIAPQELNQTSSPLINEDSIQQNQRNEQTELKNTNPEDYLRKKGLLDQIKEMLRLGNKPEAIAAAFGIKDKTGRLKSKVDPELLQNIEQYASQLPNQEKKYPGIQPISRNDVVISPNGMGEVKEVRNGQALVDIDGKLHKLSQSELHKEPEELISLDLDEPVREYLNRIPESQKSSVIDVTLYDPESNELFVRFPNGDHWSYSPVPEEIFEKINSMSGIPISSGESKLRGTIWEKGIANSAGADFFKLIKKLVREGVVKEKKLKKGIDLFKGFVGGQKRK